ncbi:rhamnogalacturonan acetylesterase [Gimesia panareensis]|uniref:Putative rhamnogalacturonan acetylesterase YesY n=1 Tax=Gimesia panareensis TaxID=2527978 RepID=A0A518A0U2_9PLAN|nr:rhamnogalacturonan acetylesterase [Gimesia panareensis]QDT25377.1 putative rhamnogalacturonan acetylesterase YesY [Gimesia panareensis]QDU48337.1 putative rhamnogalacturonan acetylesterase YesY [Gimesia panareensis]
MKRTITPVVILFLLLISTGVQAAEPAIRIMLIGDSTVSTYTKRPKDKPDLTGWGQVFGEFFNDDVTVLNRAVSGRSSSSFIREGRWKSALQEKADYLFIQFGHNDCPGKGDRETDPATTYQDYLKKYIDEARAAGMQPVLVTPMTRRVFEKGKIKTILRPYAEAMLKVGREKNVPVIDLHRKSVARFNQLGNAGSAYFSPSKSDRTHFSGKGAREIAGLVAEEIPTKVPDLKPYLKQPAP